MFMMLLFLLAIGVLRYPFDVYDASFPFGNSFFFGCTFSNSHLGDAFILFQKQPLFGKDANPKRLVYSWKGSRNHQHFFLGGGFAHSIDFVLFNVPTSIGHFGNIWFGFAFLMQIQVIGI